jgi:glucuronoarabinoxylan endo-1,4-beta-xylanase
MSDPILNDSTATANTAYISGHIYGSGLEAYPLAEQKGKEIWMTEHLVLETDWNSVLDTGKEIHDCMNAGMSAYIWWYIVRFYGPIIDDDDRRPAGTQKGDVSKRGFVMSQFARFIRPGFYRTASTAAPQANISVSSYKESDSKIVIVALNKSSNPIYQTFTILNGNVSTVNSYTTSENKNCERGDDVSVTSGKFTVLLEPSSITTFVSE